MNSDKTRLKEQSQNADQKVAKKTQKILQEVNNVTQQKNSLLNYMKPGVPTAPKVQHKISSKYILSYLYTLTNTYYPLYTYLYRYQHARYR